MDHNIGLLSGAMVALIPEKAMVELLDANPRTSRALFWATLVDEATLREWLANTLRRDPYERVAHLLTELWFRIKAVGLVQDDEFDLPLTQAEPGDAACLNAVTVNRVLQRLRAEELITLKGERLTVRDPERLLAVSNFNPNYLHLNSQQQVSR